MADSFLEVSSIVSATDKRGYVQIKRDGQPLAQLSPAEAREIAVNILDAANAAESDAFLIEFLTQQMGVKFENALQVLPEFRAFRARENSRPVEVEKVERPLGEGEC